MAGDLIVSLRELVVTGCKRFLRASQAIVSFVVSDRRKPTLALPDANTSLTRMWGSAVMTNREGKDA